MSAAFVGNTYMKGLASSSEFVRGNVWISSWRQNPALISTETFEQEKTTPEAVGWWHNSIHSVLPSYHDGFCLTSLLQTAGKVRLWYFTLLPNYMTGKEGTENEEKRKREETEDGLTGESILISCCQLSRLAFLLACSRQTPTNENPHHSDTSRERKWEFNTFIKNVMYVTLCINNNTHNNNNTMHPSEVYCVTKTINQ